jgi:hypothetical protein
MTVKDALYDTKTTCFTLAIGYNLIPNLQNFTLEKRANTILFVPLQP